MQINENQKKASPMTVTEKMVQAAKFAFFKEVHHGSGFGDERYRAAIEAAIAAQPALAVAGWQPIETAPKNGDRIILMWEPFSGVSEHVELGKWSNRNAWVNTYGHAFSGSPTHWMRLPAAPTS